MENENAKKEIKPKEKKVAIVPVEKTEYGVVLQGDPDKQLEYATKAAKVLTSVIKQKPKKVVINGEQYLEFEDWQTLGRFYGITVGVEWTHAIEREGKLFGYEARAIVYLKGDIISAAEAMCVRSERSWASRDEFSLRSMAQTRASAKALRNVLSWVAVLAGFKPTPAEEITDDMITRASEKTNSFLKKNFPEEGNAVEGEIIYETEESTRRIKCPYCGKFHGGKFAKCIDCWKTEQNGKKLVRIETKTIINEEAEPFKS